MKKNSVAVDLAYVAVFTALVIVMGFLAIPVGTAGVPIVLQNAVLILAGLILGGRRGLFVGLLFFTLGAIGLPILPGGRSILAALPGPTIGYLLAYIVSPAVAGLVAYRAPRAKVGMIITFALAAIIAVFTQYGFGALGLVARAEMPINQALMAQAAFILPDLAKLAVMVIVAVGVHTAFPDLLPRRNAQNSVR